MKTQTNTKSSHNTANPAGPRAGLRSGTAKALEHRYERRKIREQLRRLDWVANVEDEVFD
jgi:hypothetical protein